MNTFANSLFTLLFGWLRSLIQGIWTAAARGEFSRFFTWLGDHWLLVVVILCLACTVLDYLVWLLRWRPYLVWRTKLRGFMRRLRGEKVDSHRKFSQGYAEAVPLDLPEEESPPPPAYDWEQEAAYQQAEWQVPPQTQEPPLTEEAPVPPAVPTWEQAADVAPQNRYFPQPEGYQPPPVYVPSRADNAFSSDMPAARRKRRSEKYDRRRASWHERLMTGSDEEAMLDGLPPAVDREEAFREPVYPNRDAQGYDSWQRPQNHTNGTKQ